eukprot:CAMPEP_0168174264 /NCGR_PEP_ID=MMETSP0139_2-20121125/6394_1 /TAXON_ID=44445 /ORGANISM="Pseudo-nitzschia australis, Strain 10249 10 AB" /LENGTH=942 /DNA_ID=CAMNT_0008092369 /DNA_START=155 /DNA_END=2983 /DNA_ORIENTATION=-
MEGLPDGVVNGPTAPLPPQQPEPIKVYLRLRPKNKLETMKRGKDCIQLHDDPKKITVDSPRLGEHKFSFDQVFDEFSTQDEVYQDSVSVIPSKLVLQGINSTILAYGQSGSGKTHTLLGEGLGIELNALASGSHHSNDYNYEAEDHPDSREANHLHNRKNLDPKQHPNVTAGMIPRVVADVFDLLYESTSSDTSVEFSIRCSYVEIYLDRIKDLLQPAPRKENLTRVGQTTNYYNENNEACIVTELCCVCPEDVYAILARGQALRTKAANDTGIDSSRSHAIFTLHLEKTNKVSGEMSRSRLQVFDLAGSQSSPNPKPKAVPTSDSATNVERRMMNASLESFHRIVQTTLQHQQQQRKSQQPSYYYSKPVIPSPLSKVAKILQPSIGGNIYTTMICTGSPSSYSIDETIQTISFAQLLQKVYNAPHVAFQGYTLQGYQMELSLAQQRQQQMSRLIRLIAQECKHGKKKSREPKNSKVWDAVLQIVEADKTTKNESKTNGDGNDNYNGNSSFRISIYEEGEKEKEIRDLRTKLATAENKLRQERTAREKFESAYRDAASELVGIKSQEESFVKHKRRLEEELSIARANNKEVLAEKTEIQHKLRSSQFRENESILFLRQFRTFYFRLLMNKAALGSGNTRNVMEEAKSKIPGAAPDLEDLLDIDKMMVKSGIIESSEIGADTPTADYSPSKDALNKSALEARKAKEREMALIDKELSEEFGTTSSGLTRGQLITCRQKLILSPAGVLAIEREKELERNLFQLSQKCIGLQSSLNAEKSMVQALTGRQGAMTKMKQIQETIMLKTDLERKRNDLQAIVWKMNELHLVNKTLSSKAATREQHSSYLSDYLSDIQTKNQRRLSQIEKEEKRLRDENSGLRNQLDGISLDLWQLGEQLEKAPLWRCSVALSGDFLNFGEAIPDCRLSDGNLTEEEIDGLIEVVQCNA